MDIESALMTERDAFVDTLERVGPDAPTLCEGWTAADLAAHFVILERRPDAIPGISVGGPLARHTANVMAEHKDGGFEQMLARLRRRPPWVARVGAPGEVNANHHFIHHEDVRRANGDAPRPLDADLDAIIWKVLGLTAVVAMRRVPVGVDVVAPDGRHRVMCKGTPVVTIRGEPGELALYCNGRKTAAAVEMAGEDDARAAVRISPMGI